MRAYPGPSRFMAVLLANLKAGLSPLLDRGEGVVSIWIPAGGGGVFAKILKKIELWYWVVE